jgi:hypothetical protein
LNQGLRPDEHGVVDIFRVLTIQRSFLKQILRKSQASTTATFPVIDHAT